MKRIVLLTGILLLVFSCFVAAQPFNWTYVEDFVTDVSAPHGLVVDLSGNIWVQPYTVADTVVLTATDTLVVSALHVFDPSGSQIGLYWHGDLPGIGADTFAYTGRGISEDNNGNILVSNGYQYRINYQTGAFMNRYDWKDDYWSLTESAADQNGFIYCTRVVPAGDALWILDPNFQLYSIGIDSVFLITRSVVVSPDGNDIYIGAIYPPAGAVHYHSDFGPDAPYTVVDTLLGPDPSKGLWGQILDWDPMSHIWVGSYGGSDAAPTDYHGWYSIDPATNNDFQDSIGQNIAEIDTNYVPGDLPPGGTYLSPRGIDFWEENDGTWTAYTADFDGNAVKKWTNPDPFTGTIIVDNGAARISQFELRQNYPNPFNPTTTIPFTLRKTANVKLQIYNVNGQLVTTLVNKRMAAGSYEIPFDAGKLASGTYFYRVKFDDKIQTKRMMLLK